MPEQLYCNGKVIFLYNDLTPPAKQVVFGFGHFRFSEHEKRKDQNDLKPGLPYQICEKETRNGANTRIEQHLKGIMLAQICSKNRHKRTVEEKNEKI